MKSTFSIFTRISFRHEYYANEVLYKLKMYPTAQTQKLMASSNILYKAMPDGFLLFYESLENYPADYAWQILSENNDLYFLIDLSDPFFYNYTELSKFDLTQNLFLFQNSGDLFSDSDTNYLHQGSYVDNNCLVSKDIYAPFYRDKPFGMLHLQLNQNIKDNYIIRFASRQTYWRYILLENYISDIQAPYIINGDAAEVFSAPELITLPDQRKAFTFISKEKQKLSEYAKKTYQLISNHKQANENPKVIIKTLPTPDIHNMSRIGDNSWSNSISEIFIY